MGKGSETFCSTAKEGTGARPCKAESIRLKSLKCGGGDGSGRQEGRETSR